MDGFSMNIEDLACKYNFAVDERDFELMYFNGGDLDTLRFAINLTPNEESDFAEWVLLYFICRKDPQYAVEIIYDERRIFGKNPKNIDLPSNLVSPAANEQ